MKQKKYFLLFLHSKGAGKLSDEECTRKFIAGEEQYFSFIAERHSPGLLRYANTYIRDIHQCKDIVQEVFIAFVLLLRSGNYIEHGKVHHLLVKMVRNDVLNYIDHLHLHDMLFAEQAEDSDSPDDAGEEAYKPGREKMLHLRAALRSLSEKELQIFMMRYHGKASFEEIGAKLNTKPHTAMTIQARTIEKLRKFVAGNR